MTQKDDQQFKIAGSGTQETSKKTGYIVAGSIGMLIGIAAVALVSQNAMTRIASERGGDVQPAPNVLAQPTPAASAPSATPATAAAPAPAAVTETAAAVAVAPTRSLTRLSTTTADALEQPIAPAAQATTAAPTLSAAPAAPGVNLAEITIRNADGTVRALTADEVKAIAHLFQTPADVAGQTAPLTLDPSAGQTQVVRVPVERQAGADTVTGADALAALNADQDVARADTTLLTPPTPTIAAAQVDSIAATTEFTCADALSMIAEQSTIYFPSGGTDLTPEDLRKISNVGSAIDHCPRVFLHVGGHSDPTGDEQINMNLSWQRADAVVSIMQEMGFDTSRIDPVGFGSRLPKSEGDTSGEFDRRVEFTVLKRR